MVEIHAREAAVQALACTFNDGFWHPTLQQAVADLTPEQAAWKPNPDRNSIHDLVRHLVHWKKGVLDDWWPLSSRESFQAYIQRDWQPVDGGAEAWQRDVDELMRLSEELLDHVRNASPDELSKPAEGMGSPRVLSLMNVATHDAYHAGQILYLRRLQGA